MLLHIPISNPLFLLELLREGKVAWYVRSAQINYADRRFSPESGFEKYCTLSICYLPLLVVRWVLGFMFVQGYCSMFTTTPCSCSVPSKPAADSLQIKLPLFKLNHTAPFLQAEGRTGSATVMFPRLGRGLT